mmetsp:Transcript_26458/g.71479  ORF Transcript_26458/g.71479 Transcript_26458/m.71479 type:complete len:309 (+) Transcript_26458:390-1316(+)
MTLATMMPCAMARRATWTWSASRASARTSSRRGKRAQPPASASRGSARVTSARARRRASRANTSHSQRGKRLCTRTRAPRACTAPSAAWRMASRRPSAPSLFPSASLAWALPSTTSPVSPSHCHPSSCPRTSQLCTPRVSLGTCVRRASFPPSRKGVMAPSLMRARAGDCSTRPLGRTATRTWCVSLPTRALEVGAQRAWHNAAQTPLTGARMRRTRSPQHAKRHCSTAAPLTSAARAQAAWANVAPSTMSAHARSSALWSAWRSISVPGWIKATLSAQRTTARTRMWPMSVASTALMSSARTWIGRR